MEKIRRGFTLIEIMIVVSILAILAVTVTFAVTNQRIKAEDSAAKGDLARLKVAFEDYYNDHNCYPPTSWFDGPTNPQGNELQPYLDQIPFNKKTAKPYIVEKDPTGCLWFKIYTTLTNANDPQAVAQRTTDPLLGSTLGNYGVSSSNVIVSIFYNPGGSTSPTPTPTATANPNNHYYCSGAGNCSSFDNTRFNCTPNFADPNCGGPNSCQSAGSCVPLP